MKIFGVWLYDELASFINRDVRSRITLSTPNFGDFKVKVSGNRLNCLRNNHTCVSCGIEGVVWSLESHVNEAPHLNLYAQAKEFNHWKKSIQGGLILMTQDHIMPKSRGGTDTEDNLQTMCLICNNKKGSKIPMQKAA